MHAFSVESSLLEGRKELDESFEFVRDKAGEFEAYEMEVNIIIEGEADRVDGDESATLQRREQEM